MKNLKSKLLIIFIIFLSFFAINMLKPNKAEAATTVYASTSAQLASYLENTSTVYKVYLTANIKVTTEINVNSEQYLYGNGYTLSYGVNVENSPIIRVESSGWLYVYDLNMTGDKKAGTTDYSAECSTNICCNGGKLFMFNCDIGYSYRHAVHGEHVSGTYILLAGCTMHNSDTGLGHFGSGYVCGYNGQNTVIYDCEVGIHLNGVEGGSVCNGGGSAVCHTTVYDCGIGIQSASGGSIYVYSGVEVYDCDTGIGSWNGDNSTSSFIINGKGSHSESGTYCDGDSTKSILVHDCSNGLYTNGTGTVKGNIKVYDCTYGFYIASSGKGTIQNGSSTYPNNFYSNTTAGIYIASSSATLTVSGLAEIYDNKDRNL